MNSELFEEDMELEFISKLVKEGFESGYYPTWTLETEKDVMQNSESRGKIANMIKNGFREGYYPRWVLKRP